jgi:TP901 family phage tail tape measure protein
MQGLMASARGLAAIALPIGGISSFTQGIRQAIDVSKQFETTLLDIAQKADMNDQRMAQLGRRIRDLAPRINSDAQSVGKSMDYLLGAGLDAATAERVLEPIGRTAQAYMADITDVSKATYSMIDALAVPAERVQRALDIMSQAGKEGNFELSDMAKHLPAIAAQARALGMTGETAVSRITSALQIMRKGTGDASSAATNMENVLQKIISPEVTEKFKKLGIDIRAELKKVQDAGGDIFEMLVAQTQKALKGDLSKLGDIFGDAQVQQGVRALIQNIDEYRRIRQATARADGVVQQDFERRVRTFEARWTRLKASLQELGLRVGEHIMPFVTKVVDGITSVIDRISNSAALQRVGELFKSITDSLGSFEATVITAGAAVLGLVAAFAALKGAVGFLLGGAGLAAAAGGATKFGAEIATATAAASRFAGVLRLFGYGGAAAVGAYALADIWSTLSNRLRSDQSIWDGAIERAKALGFVLGENGAYGPPQRDAQGRPVGANHAQEEAARKLVERQQAEVREMVSRLQRDVGTGSIWDAVGLGGRLAGMFNPRTRLDVQRQLASALSSSQNGDLQGTLDQVTQLQAKMNDLMNANPGNSALRDYLIDLGKVRDMLVQMPGLRNRAFEQSADAASDAIRNQFDPRTIWNPFENSAQTMDQFKKAQQNGGRATDRALAARGLVDPRIAAVDPSSTAYKNLQETLRRGVVDGLTGANSMMRRTPTPGADPRQPWNRFGPTAAPLAPAEEGPMPSAPLGVTPDASNAWRFRATSAQGEPAKAEVTTQHNMSGTINVRVQHDPAFLRAEVQRQIQHAIADNRGGTGSQTYGGATVSGGGGTGGVQ